MKKYFFLLVALFLSISVFGQDANLVHHKFGLPALYTNCRVDSITIKTYGNNYNNNSIKEALYFYKFNQNGLIEYFASFGEEPKTTHIITSTISADGKSLIEIVDSKYLGDKRIEVVTQNLLKKTGNLEIWEKVTDGVMLKKDTILFKFLANGMIKSWTENKAKYKVTTEFDSDFCFSLIRLDIKDGTFACQDEHIYTYNKNGSLIKSVTNSWSKSSEIEDLNMEETKERVYKYDDIDAQGNWLTCYEYDDKEILIEYIKRKIVYPQ